MRATVRYESVFHITVLYLFCYSCFKLHRGTKSLWWTCSKWDTWDYSNAHPMWWEGRLPITSLHWQFNV